MIDENSRYFTVTRARTSDGASPAPAQAPRYAPEPLSDPRNPAVMFLRRRFLPQASLMPALQAVEVRPGDRLDLIAYRTLGDPEQAWRIADANDAMNPRELLLRRELRVPLPELSPATLEQEEPLD